MGQCSRSHQPNDKMEIETHERDQQQHCAGKSVSQNASKVEHEMEQSLELPRRMI